MNSLNAALKIGSCRRKKMLPWVRFEFLDSQVSLSFHLQVQKERQTPNKHLVLPAPELARAGPVSDQVALNFTLTATATLITLPTRDTLVCL